MNFRTPAGRLPLPPPPGTAAFAGFGLTAGAFVAGERWMGVEERALTGAAAGVLMRITVRAVLTASTSARSPGEETFAKRWMTVPPPALAQAGDMGPRGACVDVGAGGASAGAGRLSGGASCVARWNDTMDGDQGLRSSCTTGSRMSTGRTKRRTL
jgi:hypothetical protein